MINNSFTHTYSKNISLLVSRARLIVKIILEKEVKLSVQQKRFYFKGYSYPIQLVAFEDPIRLGYFDPNYYEIGINKELAHYPQDSLLLVLRHEVAHYLSYLQYGALIQDHGIEFRSICKQYGWDDSSFATFSLNQTLIAKKRSAATKITKLLNLSQSKNAHEASSALNKAQDLLIKWGIEEQNEEDTYVAKRILKSKRVSQKMRSIAHILRKFCVSPIINKGKDYTYLELFGKEPHVEVAEYIGVVLDKVIEDLWSMEKSPGKLIGSHAKTSFIQGLEEGFLSKMNAQNSNQKALPVLENQLQEAQRLAYSSLSQSMTKTKRNESAFTSGQKQGSSLLIHPSIKKHYPTSLFLE